MNSNENESKSYRLLCLFEHFSKGGIVNKKEFAEKFNVNIRSIHRDIEVLNNYFSVYQKNHAEIIYNPKKKGYELIMRETGDFSDSEIFALLKILFDSRAFSETEMNRILETLISKSLDRQFINSLIKSERLGYVPPKHGRDIIHFLWQINHAVLNNLVINTIYEKQDKQKKSYTLRPVGLVFNEFYFYLLARIAGKEKENPAVFRVDRLTNLEITKEIFTLPYRNRFEEGEFRKRIHFMYSGDLINIRFLFWGDSLEAVLDRIPTAKVVGYDGRKAIVEAQVFSNGIIRWLLSQKECLEVISPQSLRNEIKETLQKMLLNY